MGDFDKKTGNETGQDKSAFQQLGDDKGEGGERDIRSDSTEAGQAGQQSGGMRQEELAGAGRQQQPAQGAQGQQARQQPGQGQQQQSPPRRDERQQGDQDLDRDRDTDLGRGDME